MKIKISERGAWGPDGKEIKVGKVFEVKADAKIPAYLVGKFIVIGDDVPEKPEKVGKEDKGKTPVSNELTDEEKERQTRLMEVAKELSKDDFTRDGPPKLDVLNQKLNAGETAFDSAERDKLWVKA